MRKNAPHGLSIYEELDFILADETLYAVQMPRPDKTLGGRPQKYPDYSVALYGQLVQVYRSARQVHAEFDHLRVWNHIHGRVRRRFADAPELWLPEQPMPRTSYQGMKKTLVDDDEYLRAFQHASIYGAIDLTREVGLMGPGGSYTHPGFDHVLFADGKVVKPLIRANSDEIIDLATGEIIRRRRDPDARLHGEDKDDPKSFGTKFVVLATRADVGRVILGVEHVAVDGRGELGPVLDLLDLILPELPHAKALIYDGALKGVHMQYLLRKHGLLSITKVPKKASKRKPSASTDDAALEEGVPAVKGPDKGKPKGGLLEVRDVEVAPGKFRRIEIHAENGAAGTYLPNAEGDRVFVKFQRLEIMLRQNKASGEYRGYQTYRLPREFGGRSIPIRLHGDSSDGKGPDHRPEILRAIPPGDPDFEALYGRRSDIESINRDIENRLYWNRAHSLGSRAQLFDLICYARTINAITKGKHRAGLERTQSA